MRRTRIGRALAAVLVLASAGLTAGCVAPPDTDRDGSVVRYQTSPGLINLAEMADALGYLHGIRLKSIGVVQGGPQALEALATGQADFAGAFVGSAANLIANGTPIKAVIAYYGSAPRVLDEVLVRSNSTITRPADLVGKKIAVNTLGAQAEALIDLWLKRSGLSPEQISQVTLVPLPAINAEAALRNGQVDAALLNASLLTNALKGGGLRAVMRDTKLFGSYNGGSYEVRDSWLKAYPSTARKLVGAMAKAVEWMQIHPPKQTLALYTTWLDAHGQRDNATALSSWVGTGIATRGGVLSKSDYRRWTGWLRDKGLVRSDPHLGSIFTNRYNPYAGSSASNDSENP